MVAVVPYGMQVAPRLGDEPAPVDHLQAAPALADATAHQVCSRGVAAVEARWCSLAPEELQREGCLRSLRQQWKT